MKIIFKNVKRKYISKSRNLDETFIEKEED